MPLSGEWSRSTRAELGTRRSRSRRLARVAGALLAVASIVLLASPAQADILDELREKLFERRRALQAVEGRIEEYREEAAEKRAEATTLKGQITIIEGQVTSLRLELDKTSIEIEETVTESAAIAEEIRRTEENIQEKRVQLREALRLIQVLEADSLVEAFFKYPTLTSILVETRALVRFQQRTSETLGRIHSLKQELTAKADAVRDLERELRELQDRQERQKKTLEEQHVAKERLFEVTKAQEAEFQKLLAETAEQHKRAQAEITRVEAVLREELERQGLLRLGGVGIFDWPVDPLFGISCGFHCPDYPYRNILGPHTGIDVPAHVGTSVRAGADGYVARAFDAGGPGYSYLLLIHGDNLSTVYGHLSSIGVPEGEYVTRGQVVGGTGGVPGSRGAGLSTGPHLHFEVRKDGIPVDPAGYLP